MREKKIKICAESSFAHINLSVSVVQRVCIVASCELWHVPVIMHLIWPQTKTFASAFERKGRAAVTGHLSHASPPLEPILWKKQTKKTRPLRSGNAWSSYSNVFHAIFLRLLGVGVFITLINGCINHNSALLIT